jgi:hypothetical protein
MQQDEDVRVQGVAWAFGGTIFVLVYCTAGVSGGHINPAVTFGLFLARKLSLPRALYYAAMQCLGAVCGRGRREGVRGRGRRCQRRGERVHPGRRVGCGDRRHVRARVRGVLRHRREHVPLLLPLPIGFAVFLVHLATIPITGTGIQPSQEPRRRHHLRPAARLARTRKFVCARSNTLVRGAASKFKILTVACFFRGSGLGWAAHRSWACGRVPPGHHPGHPFQGRRQQLHTLLAPADVFVLVPNTFGSPLCISVDRRRLCYHVRVFLVYECFFISIFVFVSIEIYWNC